MKSCNQFVNSQVIFTHRLACKQQVYLQSLLLFGGREAMTGNMFALHILLIDLKPYITRVIM